MYLIKAIPISKSVSKELLSYFSKDIISPGFVVEITIRSKTGLGLVLSCTDLKELKADIKSLPYNLKKIGKVKSKDFLSKEFVEACGEVAKYYVGTTGQVLYSLIPKVILENLNEIKIINSGSLKSETEKVVKDFSSETLTIQTSFEERYSEYRSLIREEFAKKKSIFFCMPSIEDIKTAKENLVKGISEYTYTFDSLMTKKEIILKWNEVLNNPHPVLIIATPLFLSIKRKDIETVVIENESSRGFISQIKPYIDFRKTVEILSSKMHWRVIFGDMALRVETIHKVKIDKYKEFSSLKFRPNSGAVSKILDMRAPEDKKDRTFTVLSDELKNLIEETKENSKNLFIYCTRKGLNPTTICADCGNTTLCDNCNWPVVLYQKKADQNYNVFICPKCGLKSDTLKLCNKCQSWRLTPLGIGIELGYKEIKKNFPDIEVFLMDKDNVKTQKEANRIIDKFYKTPGSILLGTEMVLAYLNKKIESSAILSLDSLFSIPDFRINEKIMRILIRLRDLSLQNFLIQTRNPENNNFLFGVKGNLLDFYKTEIDERKEVGYPPFCDFIKISLIGDKVTVQKKMEELKNFLTKEVNPNLKKTHSTNSDPDLYLSESSRSLASETSRKRDFEVSVFKSLNSGISKNYIANCLIKLDNDIWPNEELLEKLYSLPPQYLIKVDPDTIL